MVYIPFPQENLNNHTDLAAWRLNANKRVGDWKRLKDFLAEQPRLIADIHPTPKCWYSELPQGDNSALDVEHFRPKNQASPLSAKQIKALEKQTGFKFRQDNTEGAYSWLEFDYRNYRLVTAVTNRGGAKHIYFPIAENSVRLNQATFPWHVAEYPYFLDPANAHDAALLLVLPNGEIAPITDKTNLTNADFTNLEQIWQSDGFNYIRAAVTIQLYRLNDRIFKVGRQEVYNKVHSDLILLEYCFPIDNARFENLKNGLVESLTKAALPSAPFSLAARCALKAYTASAHIDAASRRELEEIPHQILDKIDKEVAKRIVSWGHL